MDKPTSGGAMQEVPSATQSLRLPDPASLGSAAVCRPPRTSFAAGSTSEESNHYRSAGELMRQLASTITEWRKQLPDDAQPAVIAVLHGGIRIDVTSLSQQSFHGIRVDGTLDGVPCFVLAHQDTVQLLCYVQPVSPPETPRRRIGFIIDGEATEA